MDEQQLQDAEARAKSATPGEWWMSSEVKEDDAAVWGPDGDAIAEKVGGNLTIGGTGNDNAALAERDALMVQVDQWRRTADREVTACVEMRAERDAAWAALTDGRRVPAVLAQEETR